MRNLSDNSHAETIGDMVMGYPLRRSYYILRRPLTLPAKHSTQCYEWAEHASTAFLRLFSCMAAESLTCQWIIEDLPDALQLIATTLIFCVDHRMLFTRIRIHLKYSDQITHTRLDKRAMANAAILCCRISAGLTFSLFNWTQHTQPMWELSMHNEKLIETYDHVLHNSRTTFSTARTSTRLRCMYGEMFDAKTILN